ncbi:hypothetical protein L873DRAFT_1823147 [Choiromyces venosus 120613-1]|uniref:Uncharacterized protein n=1 Tax=Choiromyces venosus 120613-1 TaxID=1336337 RepID=A0A3N4IVR2_9PEZI|nr:hypothetical protein L873DRAFT_1823605 [Choiromyces venosus 120613-1]RPA89303.1 hypothetical protein L873DRAFT_1823147 [Choiromyces venosus 120613-1]
MANANGGLTYEMTTRRWQCSALRLARPWKNRATPASSSGPTLLMECGRGSH